MATTATAEHVNKTPRAFANPHLLNGNGTTVSSGKKNVKMTGYLEKRSKMVGWKKFWFVLDGRLLTYYKSCADYNSQLSACSGSINVGIASVVRPLQLKGYKGFALQITTRTQIYFLRSPEKKQLENWLLAIQGLVTSPRAEDRWADASIDGEFSHVNYNNNSPYSPALPLNKRTSTNSSQWTLNNYCMSTEDLTSSKINGLPVSSNYTQPSSTLKKFHSLISLNSPHQNHTQTSGFLRSHKKPINTMSTIPRTDINHQQIEEFKRELKRRVSDREKFTPESSTTSTESPPAEEIDEDSVGQEKIDMTPDLIKGTLPKNIEEIKKPPQGLNPEGGKKSFRPSQFDEFIDFERDVYEPCEAAEQVVQKSDQVDQENIYEIVDDTIEANQQMGKSANEKPSEWKDFPLIGKEPMQMQMYKRLAQGNEKEKPARPPAPNFDQQQNVVDKQQNQFNKSKTPEYTILKPLKEPSPSPPPVKSVRNSPRIPQRVESLDDCASEGTKIVMKKVSGNNHQQQQQDTLSISSNDSGKNKSNIGSKEKDKDKKWFGGRIFSKIFQKDKDKSTPTTTNCTTSGQLGQGGCKRGSQIVISAPVDLRCPKSKGKNQNVLMDELRERVVQLNRMNSSEPSQPSAPRTSIDNSILFQKVSQGKNVLKKSLTLPDNESPPEEFGLDLDLTDKEIHIVPEEIVEKPTTTITRPNLTLELDDKSDKFQEKLARFNRISSQLSPSFNQVLNPHEEGNIGGGIRKYNSFKYSQKKKIWGAVEDPPVLPPKKKNLPVGPVGAPDYDVPQNNSPIPPPVPVVGPPSSDDEEIVPKSFPKKKYSAPAMNFETLYELQAFGGSKISPVTVGDSRKSPTELESWKPKPELKLKYSIEEVEEVDEQLIYENFENVYCNCSELLALGDHDHDVGGDSGKPLEYANVQVEQGVHEELDEFYENVHEVKVNVKNQVQEDIYNSPEVLQALQILEEAIESLEADYGPSCDCSKIDENGCEFLDLPPPPPPPPEEFYTDAVDPAVIIDEFPSPPTPEELDEIIESHICSPPSSDENAGNTGNEQNIDSNNQNISTSTTSTADNQLIGNLKIDLKSGQTTFSTETPPPTDTGETTESTETPPKEELQSSTSIEKPQNELLVKYATVNTIIQETETVQETQELEELTELYDDFPYDFLPIPSPTPPAVAGEEPTSAGDGKTSRNSVRHSGIDQLELFLQKHVTNQKVNFGPPVINRLGHSSAVNQLQKIVIHNQESPHALQKSYI